MMPETLQNWLFPRLADKSWEVSYSWSQDHSLFCILVPTGPAPAVSMLWLSWLTVPRSPAWNLLSMHLKSVGQPDDSLLYCRAPVCQDCHGSPSLLRHTLCPPPPSIHHSCLTTSELQPAEREVWSKPDSPSLQPHPSLCLPMNPIWCGQHWLPSFLSRAAKLKPVSNLGEYHLFKNAKHNLGIEYGHVSIAFSI